MKLNPKCLNGKMQMAITNQGELIPCCYCDSGHTRDDPVYKKLLSVSKIDDYDSIQDILKTPEWKEFEKNLRKNIGIPACIITCEVRDNDDMMKKETLINFKLEKTESRSV